MEHPTLISQLLKGTLRSQPCRGRPRVKQHICVCSTFAGLGRFTESLTEEMSESSTATISAGLSILGHSPRYCVTYFVILISQFITAKLLCLDFGCFFPPLGEHVWSWGISESIGGHGEREETAGWPWRMDRQHDSCMLILPDKIRSLLMLTYCGFSELD